MTAQDTPNAGPLDAAQVDLVNRLRDLGTRSSNEAANEIETLSQQLSEARAELKNRWQRMDSAPRDGTRILLAWEPYSGISEHVELGKWKSQNGWCNTYGKPFSGEPDAWAALAPFSLSPEAAELALSKRDAPQAQAVDWVLHDWEYKTPNGSWAYARTPEKAEQLVSQGVKLTPVYTPLERTRPNDKEQRNG